MRLEIKNEDGETIFDSKFKDSYFKSLNKKPSNELSKMLELCNDSGDFLYDIFLDRLPVDLDEEI